MNCYRWEDFTKCLVFYHCIVIMRSGELITHPFLHCLMTLRLWHKLFRLTKLDWISPRSISDTMTISFKSLRSTIKSKVLWQNVYLILIWLLRWEENIPMEEFEDLIRPNLFLFLILGFYYYKFWGHSLQCYSTPLEFGM